MTRREAREDGHVNKALKNWSNAETRGRFAHSCRRLNHAALVREEWIEKSNSRDS